MIATLRSELIKLKTVRSTWIATAVFIVLSLGLWRCATTWSVTRCVMYCC